MVPMDCNFGVPGARWRVLVYAQMSFLYLLLLITGKELVES